MCPFGTDFGFLANRLWPIGYVNLRGTKSEPKSSHLDLKASFASISLGQGSSKETDSYCLICVGGGALDG